MNGWERIRAALAGRWPDRRPVMLHNFRSAAREAKITQKEFRENPAKAADALIRATEKYRLDGVLVDVDTATLAGALGAPVDAPEDEPARVYGGRLDSLDRLADLPAPDIGSDPGIRSWLEISRRVKAHFGKEVFVRGNCDQAPFSLASMMRSPAEWMLDCASGDARVFQLLDTCTEACVQFLVLMAEAGVDMVSNGDSPAGPEMISPRMYRTFALPYERRLAETAHRLGLPYGLHICGITDLILEDMIETGADAFELDHRTDIHRVFALINNRVTLFGTIDPVHVLASGRPGDVERTTRELLEMYRASPRLVVNAGCALTPDTPEENIRCLVETVRTFSALPSD